jgi:hypothetical protein
LRYTFSTTFPPQVYQPSTVARDQGIQYFSSIGLNHELFSPVGTDAFNFNEAGIPASGMLTGQDCCKTQGDVDLFGGSLGNFEGNVLSFDGGCVDNPFRWCDNLGSQARAVGTGERRTTRLSALSTCLSERRSAEPVGGVARNIAPPHPPCAPPTIAA